MNYFKLFLIIDFLFVSIICNSQSSKAEMLMKYCSNYVYFVTTESPIMCDFWDDGNINDIKKGIGLSYALQDNQEFTFKLSHNLSGKGYKLRSDDKAAKAFNADYGRLVNKSNGGWLNSGNDGNNTTASAILKFNKELKNLSYRTFEKNIILRIGNFGLYGITGREYESIEYVIFLYVDGEKFPQVYENINQILKKNIVLDSDFECFLEPASDQNIETIDLQSLQTPEGDTIDNFSIPEQLITTTTTIALLLLAEKDKKYKKQNEKSQQIVSNTTNFTPSYLTKQQKYFLEKKIIDLTGLKIDVNNTNQEYLEFTNPDRYLEDFEKTGGFMRFPQKTMNMKLGEILSVFIERFKPSCKNQEFCEIAATNTFYALLASNALTASKSMSGRKKLDMLRVGLFISELYKSDERNKCTSLYEGMSGVLDQKINEIINDKYNYSAYHNPTADFVLSLSKQETAAFLVGLVGIGTSIALSWGRQISRNLDYTDLSSYSTSNVLDDKDAPCYVVLERDESPISYRVTYIIRCKGGSKKTIFYDPKFDKPYSHGNLSPGRKTLDEAAKKACACW